MKNIESLISKYLQKETQYAIQLNGLWGRGKTYYYKTVLHDQIAASPILNNASINYRPVYISLFGLNSIQDIEIKIFHELAYQTLYRGKKQPSKAFKQNINITSRLIKLLLHGYLAFQGIKNSVDLVSEASLIAKDTVDTTNILICFDDLERKSEDLSIEDFTGYVNSLVEENVKVLIICNEDKIKEETYKSFKEKIVGIEHEYNPDPHLVVTSIINNRYQSSLVYQEFLNSLFPLLVELVNKNTQNYRHLIYALDCLHDVYSTIKKDILDIKTDITVKCQEELSQVARFLLVCAIEFKASNLSSKDIIAAQQDFMESVWMADGSDTLIGSNKSKNNKYHEITSKYYSDLCEYHFYESIFLDVTGSEEFSVDHFINEFKKNYRIEKGYVLPEYMVLNKLDTWTALGMSDEEYKDNTTKMLEYAMEGKYKLSEYLTVSYYARRFDNPLELDLAEIQKNILKAISSITITDIEDRFSFEHQDGYSPEQEEIRKHGLSLIEKIKTEKEKKHSENIVASFVNNLDVLYNEYHKDETLKEELNRFPVFKMIDTDLFVEKLIVANPFAITFVTSFLNDRYLHSNINYSDESFALNAINRKLCDYLKDNPEKSRRIWTLKNIQKKLDALQNKHGIPFIGH